MSLFGLRPEEPAAIRIREAATRGTLSHALLLTGSGDRMSRPPALPPPPWSARGRRAAPAASAPPAGRCWRASIRT